MTGRSSKTKTPSSREIPSPKPKYRQRERRHGQPIGGPSQEPFWSLGLGASLELGAWSLELSWRFHSFRKACNNSPRKASQVANQVQTRPLIRTAANAPPRER